MSNDAARPWDDRVDRKDGMVSVTQLQGFGACRRRWHYGYVRGLRPRRDRGYLTVGRMVHAGFEAALLMRAAGCESVGEMVDGGLQAIGDEARLTLMEFDGDPMEAVDGAGREACAIFEEALPEFDPTRWDVVEVGGRPAVELHFVMPCPPARGLHGYVDSVLRERSTGQVWCVDYKFRGRLADADEERFSLQRAVYARALRDMGVPITGTLTWQRLRRPQAVPRLLRDGTMSRARVLCTWEAYEGHLVDAGLDPADYADMREKLADVEVWRETRELRSDEYLDRVWEEVVAPLTAEAAECRECGHPYPVPTMDPFRCRSCPFCELCQAELRGYDSAYIEESGFIVADWARQ